ncbi:MAG: GDSL-type esterase/lipase family protein, partial [Hyphomicrobiaceae bacterium]
MAHFLVNGSWEQPPSGQELGDATIPSADGRAAMPVDIGLPPANGSTIDLSGAGSRARVIDLSQGFWTDAARVLPLGDSNTHGYSYDSQGNLAAEDIWESYRRVLWDGIVGQGSWIDYVGAGENGTSALPDRQHQGVSGITVTEVVGQALAIANAQHPDVVLMMLGTNDLGEVDAATSVPADMLSIMQSFASVNPGVRFAIAELPPLEVAIYGSDIVARRNAVNAALPALISQAQGLGLNAFLVSMPGLTPGDLTDGIHLTPSGFAEMAGYWLSALDANITTANGTFGGTRNSIASGVLDAIGSDLGDRITGSAGANLLDGRGGNDLMAGGGGNDTLVGGSGRDTISGGSGLDIVTHAGDFAAGGSAGVYVDLMNGFAQDGFGAYDALSGIEGAIGSGRDRVAGSLSDVLIGDDLANYFDGGAGLDYIVGNGGNDTIVTGDGKTGQVGDIAVAGAGNDSIVGGT